ncbi:MAG: hypothetical protein IKI41_00825 [Clostridia bacterium]|nr:hypothetical protein [Clostridia bacterium]
MEKSRKKTRKTCTAIRAESVPGSAGQWLNIKKIPVDQAPWADRYPYKCEAFAQVVFTHEGVAVKLTALQSNPVAECREDNGDVWADDCLEFFVMPDSRTGVYLNFECNSNGAILVGRGTERHGRERVFPEGGRQALSVSVEKDENCWSVTYFVPGSVLGEVYRPRCNFYKCEERVPERAHFQSAFFVAAENPDFHRPECFGRLRVAGLKKTL